MVKTVLVSCLGASLDRGSDGRRWEHWRPSVGVVQQEGLVVDRYHFLVQDNFGKLAEVVARDIEAVSPETELIEHRVHIANVWDFEQVYSALHGLARELQLDPRDNNLVHITTGTHVMQICLFLLTESRHFPGRLLQSSPPKRENQGPEGTVNIIDLDLARYDSLATRFEEESRDDIAFLKSGIDTRNADFNRLIEQIEKVALRTVDPILLMGPTGAGKSQLARKIYDLAVQRRGMTGEFVEVNCATLHGQSAMSTLFGHRKGSYTGATSDRAGLLRTAQKGMLFLDEVGELGLDEQAMLLRAIEEKIFYPLGSDAPVKSSFQLLCGTNRDLRSRVAEGAFREDLLARIDTWSFVLPGLRERREDIEPNLHYELQRFSEITGKRVRMNSEARKAFLRFARASESSWHGNFRDLNAAVKRMATLAPQGRITEAEVADEVQRLQERWQGGEGEAASSDLAEILSPEQIGELDLFDRLQLERVIAVCRECRSMAEAGRRLFQHSREQRSKPNDSDRIRKYLAKFGVKWEDVRS